jgi:hypothetical protein
MSPERKLANSFPLRLSPTMRQQVEHLADREGISINQFIGLAVAEKVMRMEGYSGPGKATSMKPGEMSADSLEKLARQPARIDRGNE